MKFEFFLEKYRGAEARRNASLEYDSPSVTGIWKHLYIHFF